jgi:DNA repair protein RecO (recombination protein O)
MPDRVRSFRTEAIVLRHSDWGEADRLLILFTRELGKARAIAKGARKMRSRKAGHLEPFTRASLQLARGRDLLIVTQAETIDAHLRLREDLERIGYASYVVELLDRFTYDEGENRSLYRLLADTLARLDAAPDPALPVRYYEIRLLDLLGYRPQLFACANCENEILPVEQSFSASQGGVLCPNCAPNFTEAVAISVPALKYLRHFQRSTYAEASRARLTPALNDQLERVLQYYLTYLLERGLNSPAFIREVRRRETPSR